MKSSNCRILLPPKRTSRPTGFLGSASRDEPPVLFLIFNRPGTTAQVMEAIRIARPPRLYIAADGPRDRPGEKELCARTRQIATDINWPCQSKTLFRERNLGCGISVSGALDWFFSQEEDGIILEDDCVPSSSF